MNTITVTEVSWPQFGVGSYRHPPPSFCARRITSTAAWIAFWIASSSSRLPVIPHNSVRASVARPCSYMEPPKYPFGDSFAALSSQSLARFSAVPFGPDPGNSALDMNAIRDRDVTAMDPQEPSFSCFLSRYFSPLSIASDALSVSSGAPSWAADIVVLGGVSIAVGGRSPEDSCPSAVGDAVVRHAAVRHTTTALRSSLRKSGSPLVVLIVSASRNSPSESPDIRAAAPAQSSR